MTLHNLTKMVRDCKACRLVDTCIGPVVPCGDLKARLMFVGRNPGEQEDNHNMPFFPNKNNAGQVYEDMLTKLELLRKEVYTTNVVKCYTSVPKKNRAPSIDEILECSPRFLAKEIQLLQPELIITFGKEAIQTVAGNGEKIVEINLSKVVGSIWKTKYEQIVFPMYHPAAMSYNITLKSDFEESIKTLGKILSNYKEEIRRGVFRSKVISANKISFL